MDASEDDIDLDNIELDDPDLRRNNSLRESYASDHFDAVDIYTGDEHALQPSGYGDHSSSYSNSNYDDPQHRPDGFSYGPQDYDDRSQPYGDSPGYQEPRGPGNQRMSHSPGVGSIIPRVSAAPVRKTSALSVTTTPGIMFTKSSQKTREYITRISETAGTMGSSTTEAKKGFLLYCHGNVPTPVFSERDVPQPSNMKSVNSYNNIDKMMWSDMATLAGDDQKKLSAESTDTVLERSKSWHAREAISRLAALSGFDKLNQTIGLYSLIHAIALRTITRPATSDADRKEGIAIGESTLIENILTVAVRCDELGDPSTEIASHIAKAGGTWRKHAESLDIGSTIEYVCHLLSVYLPHINFVAMGRDGEVLQYSLLYDFTRDVQEHADKLPELKQNYKVPIQFMGGWMPGFVVQAVDGLQTKTLDDRIIGMVHKEVYHKVQKILDNFANNDMGIFKTIIRVADLRLEMEMKNHLEDEQEKRRVFEQKREKSEMALREMQHRAGMELARDVRYGEADLGRHLGLNTSGRGMRGRGRPQSEYQHERSRREENIRGREYNPGRGHQDRGRRGYGSSAPIDYALPGIGRGPSNVMSDRPGPMPNGSKVFEYRPSLSNLAMAADMMSSRPTK